MCAIRAAALGLLSALVVSHAAFAEQDNYVDITRGKALATVGDCIACHTAPGGKPFAAGATRRRR
jgi:mono/diheme cytochrome c family protein